MISRIRVESRANSMEEARVEVQMILDHLRMVGLLEGVVPRSSRVTDESFGQNRSQDKWHDVGLHFEGRMVVQFDPEFQHDGGLKQFGYQVTHNLLGPDRPADDSTPTLVVTDGVIVLERQRKVTRESVLETEGMFVEVGNVEDAESILSEIRAHPLVVEVKVTHVDDTPDGAIWVVRATLVDAPALSGVIRNSESFGIPGFRGQYVAHGDEALRTAAGEVRAALLQVAALEQVVENAAALNLMRERAGWSRTTAAE